MTLALSNNVADKASDPAITINPIPYHAWCDGIATFTNVIEGRRATHDQMLAAIRVPCGFAVLEDRDVPVAYGLAVAERGMVGLFDIVTDPTMRRQGYGRQLVSALLGWSKRHAATTAYLQVVATNKPAIALYSASDGDGLCYNTQSPSDTRGLHIPDSSARTIPSYLPEERMFAYLLSVASISWLVCPSSGHANCGLSAEYCRVVVTAPIAEQDSQPKPWSDDLQAKLKAAQAEDQAEAHQHRTVDLPSMGPIQSPHDTARGTVGKAHVSVAYGRPSMRGRTIFGQLVPYDQIWRTGANEATLLTADKDIIIGGLPIPAGKYSLYTIPSQSGWQLIINREVGQWGLSYHEEFDYGRVSMTTSATKEPVEKFSIDFSKGKLRMLWANTVAEIPVSQKK